MKINTQRLQWLYINATELANLVFEWADGYASEDEVEKAWELMEDMLDELQDIAPRPTDGEKTENETSKE